ncbi:MAG: hypothetical protein KGH75_04100 [Rhodospirillales bacterium]|nr:hypothetical protein [Rhodospirillales bacterium]
MKKSFRFPTGREIEGFALAVVWATISSAVCTGLWAACLVMSAVLNHETIYSPSLIIVSFFGITLLCGLVVSFLGCAVLGISAYLALLACHMLSQSAFLFAGLIAGVICGIIIELILISFGGGREYSASLSFVMALGGSVAAALAFWRHVRPDLRAMEPVL